MRGSVHQGGHQPESDGTPGPPRDLILAFLASWRFNQNGIIQPTFFHSAYEVAGYF